MRRKASGNDSVSYPALKLAQHELADDIHAGVAVVQAGDET